MQKITDEVLDLIESLMGGRKGTPSAIAARDVMVNGVSRADAQNLHSVSRMALSRAILARLGVLKVAVEIAALTSSPP